MAVNRIPIYEQYTPTIKESACYFRLWGNKRRRRGEENPDAPWLIRNGNRIQIKRRQFEKMIDTLDVI